MRRYFFAGRDEESVAKWWLRDGLFGEVMRIKSKQIGRIRVVRGYTVHFLTEPRDEPYGRVVVFRDIAGNKWDLLGAVPKGS